jgi:calmodulin-binding transcription activator
MQQPVDGTVMGNFFGASSPSVSVNNLGKLFTPPSNIIYKYWHLAHVWLSTAAGYLGEMQPTAANFTSHFATRNDIASVFNDTGSELGGGPKTSIDSVLLGEPFPEYPGGFMESTLYSSVATLGNSLEDGLQTFMSEALYTNNLTQKEVDALGAAGITSSKVICYFLVFLNVSKSIIVSASAGYLLCKHLFL